MSSQEEADDPPIIFGRGTRQQYFSFSTTTRFYDLKQKQNYSVLTSRSIAATSETIRSSGAKLREGRGILIKFIVGVKTSLARLPVRSFQRRAIFILGSHVRGR